MEEEDYSPSLEKLSTSSAVIQFYFSKMGLDSFLVAYSIVFRVDQLIDKIRPRINHYIYLDYWFFTLPLKNIY